LIAAAASAAAAAAAAVIIACFSNAESRVLHNTKALPIRALPLTPLSPQCARMRLWCRTDHNKYQPEESI
jgi:hypothetical protein